MTPVLMLLFLCVASMRATPTPRAAAVIKPKPVQTNYVACTAVDVVGLESAYSNEAKFTNQTAIVSWDVETNSEVIGYRVYVGKGHTNYSRMANVNGRTNNTITIHAAQPLHHQVTVTAAGALRFKPSMDAPQWQATTNPWVAIDPPGMFGAFEGQNSKAVFSLVTLPNEL